MVFAAFGAAKQARRFGRLIAEVASALRRERGAALQQRGAHVDFRITLGAVGFVHD